MHRNCHNNHNCQTLLNAFKKCPIFGRFYTKRDPVVFVERGLNFRSVSMERKNDTSCRLAVNEETGRVQWCVGEERTWPTKLKRLALFPLILLSILIIIIIIARNAVYAEPAPNQIRVIVEEPDILNHFTTQFIQWNNQTVIGENDFERITGDLFKESNYHANDTKYSSENQNVSELIRYQSNNKNATINTTIPPKVRKKQVIENEENDRRHIIISNNSLLKTFWKNELTEEEVRTLQSQEMQRYMNKTMDPCKDFFTYACGNWKNYHKIPKDRASYDTFEILRENLDIILEGLLNDSIIMASSAPPTLPHYKFRGGHVNIRGTFEDGHKYDKNSATVKAQYLFKSCMNLELLRKRSTQPLKELLKVLGGFPALNKDWDPKKFDVVWLLAQLKLFNNDVLISEWVGPDIKNSEQYIIQIDQTTLGLPTKEYFLDKANLRYYEAYKEFMIKSFMLLDLNVIDAERAAEEILTFEKKLATIMDAPSERKNISSIYLRTTIGTLSAYFPQFDWLRYFTMVLGMNMSPYDNVVCYCLPYLHKLVDLLGHSNESTVANYIMWRFIRHRTNNLDDKFLKAKQKFYFTLFGREKDPPRWQFCVNQVNSNMGMAVGALFVRKYFDEQSKNDTLEMTLHLQDAFQSLLDKNEWIDDDTKEYARKKIKRMNLKIGYPNFLLHDSELDKIYYDIEMHPDYFFENILSLLRHATRQEQGRLNTIVNRTVWSAPPAIVNAYYSRNKNQIMFPAGILQPPFYHRHFPRCLNFGGIGVVIGHEITHGFDDKGRLFDSNGNLDRWWKKDAIDQFHARAQCMIDQYSSYIIPIINLPLDGVITQGENIADNGGLKQSFKAYQLWVKDHPRAVEKLPGLNLTGEQLFFLNFAQIWCGLQRPETAKSRMKTAVHSPGVFRVIGTLSNSADFSRVYNCPANSPMNPGMKCVIW